MVARGTCVDKNLTFLKELANQGLNKVCFDCGQQDPTYVNLTIGSFVCMSCIELLRNLNPPHKIKSISMSIFSREDIDFIRKHGNLICRNIWLGKNHSLVTEDEWRKELPMNDYLIQKYEKKLWFLQESTSELNNKTDDCRIKNLVKRKKSSQVSKTIDTSVESIEEPGDKDIEKTSNISVNNNALKKVDSKEEECTMKLAYYLGNDPFDKYDKYAPLAELEKNKLESQNTKEHSTHTTLISPSNPFQFICYKENNTLQKYQNQISTNLKNDIGCESVDYQTRRRPSGILTTDSPRFSWYDRILNQANTSNGLHNQININGLDTESCHPLPFNASQFLWQNSPNKETLPKPLLHNPNSHFSPQDNFHEITFASQQCTQRVQRNHTNESRNPFKKDVVVDKENSYSNNIRRKIPHHQQPHRKKSNNPFE